MARKTKSSKRLHTSGIGKPNAEQETVNSTTPLPRSSDSNKRSLPPDKLKKPTPVAKRRKQVPPDPDGSTVLTTSAPTTLTPAQSTVSPSTADARLPPETLPLLQTYIISPMSILSSAKMSQKISLVLARIGTLSSAHPTSKPGLVMLYAKAAVASKMISIVEIVKKEVARERGTWWQYCKLEAKDEEMKPRKERALKGGKEVEANFDGGLSREAQVARTCDGSKAGGVAGLANAEPDEVVDADSEDDSEEAFQTMTATPQASAQEERKQVRNVPVMTIYIARVPVPALKELYGEQTNARAPDGRNPSKLP